MFERVIELKEALLPAMAIIDHPFLTILKVFEEIAEEINSENKVTVSKIIPLIKVIRSSVRNIEIEKTTQAKPMMQSVLTGISARFGIVENVSLLAESTLLDPRFKKRGFESDTAYHKACQSVARLVTNLQIS